MATVTIDIDLRAHWHTVRDQGTRASCLACAAADAHSLCHGLEAALSVEYLFCQAGKRMPNGDVSAGLTFEAADAALQTDGQPLEAEWPYLPATPSPWTPPPVKKRWYGALINPAVAATDVEAALRARTPVVLGIRLTSAFFESGDEPHVLPARGAGFGGHAVLALGLGRAPTHGTVLLIRNSWGTRWRSNGYAWLPQAYLEDKLIGYRTLAPRQPL